MFTSRALKAIDTSKIVGIRVGKEHRFIGVWAVVVGGRVFVRSWEGSRGGWYRLFLEEPQGTLQVGERQIRVRARPTRSERLLDGMDAAYRAKYRTPGALKYVRGFARKSRRARSIELLPAHAG